MWQFVNSSGVVQLTAAVSTTGCDTTAELHQLVALHLLNRRLSETGKV